MIHYEMQNECSSGTNVMIFKIFSPKDLAKILLVCAKNITTYIGFTEKTPTFAENCENRRKL
jgi:hypothetical protein